MRLIMDAIFLLVIAKISEASRAMNRQSHNDKHSHKTLLVSIVIAVDKAKIATQLDSGIYLLSFYANIDLIRFDTQTPL